MSNNLRNNVYAAICTIALLFAAAVGVDAQTEDPILDDEIVASIQDGDIWWIVPASLQTELEDHLSGTATVETLDSLVNRLPAANSTNSVRFEGGYPENSVKTEINNLGYGVQTWLNQSQTDVAGATMGVSYTN